MVVLKGVGVWVVVVLTGVKVDVGCVWVVVLAGVKVDVGGGGL